MGAAETRVKRSADYSTRGAAFTLLELVLVLAMISVLALLVSYGFASAMQASALSAGTAMVRDTLALGHASAVAQNIPVEVRFYAPSTSSSGTPVYTALQLHWLKSDGTTPAVTQVVSLPSWVVIDGTPAHSSLIGANPEMATPDPGDRLLNSSTRVFHFLADGTTDLNPATNWCVTIRPGNTSAAAQLPANWACIVVDPASGRPQIYRP